MENKVQIETYELLTSRLSKKILGRNGKSFASSIAINPKTKWKIQENNNLGNLYDFLWLRQPNCSPKNKTSIQKNLVDLFCGTGPMSLGVVEGGRALGIEVKPVLAIDFDKSSTLNYSFNFPECTVINDDISNLIDGEIGNKITAKEKKLISTIGKVDILIGGPPCQGHSDLNNHTRRNDPKNELIFKVVRFAEITTPDYVVIENVQGIRHDKNGVVK